MILVILLATSALITIARASPMSYATYRRRELPVDERPGLLLLYDQRGLENTDPPLHSANDIDRDYPIELSLQDENPNAGKVLGSSLSRTKKLGLSRNSLSIVNPVDVLRQRVLLELARRKAMQDQRQVDANRRILETIGKRSVQEVDSGFPRTSRSIDSVNNHDHFGDLEIEKQQQLYTFTQRIPVDGPREWSKTDNSANRGSTRISIGNTSHNSDANSGDVDSRKVPFNY